MRPIIIEKDDKQNYYDLELYFSKECPEAKVAIINNHKLSKHGDNLWWGN